MKPPGFVRNGADNSLQEYQAFLAASEDKACYLLAELARLQASGKLGEAQIKDDNATSLGGLYCRKCDGWAVFYAIKQKPFEVTIILAGDMATESFSSLEGKAANRRAGVVDGY